MSSFWDTRREIRQLWAQLDQAFRAARQRAEEAPAWAPPIDYMAGAEGLTILCDLPGVEAQSLYLEAEPGALWLSGEKRPTHPAEARPLRQERAYGTFRRLIPLPEWADLGRISAKLQDGVLCIQIGRKPETMPRRIAIEVEAAAD